MGSIYARQTRAKLSEGNMTATEAKYHKNYLTNMCNKYKVKQKNEAVEKETIIKYRRYLYPIFKFMYT